MFCKHCGNKINPEAKFCNTCGTAIVQTITDQDSQEPSDRQANQDLSSPVIKTEARNNDMVTPSSTPFFKKITRKWSKKTTIITIISVVSALLISIGGYFIGLTQLGEAAQIEKFKTAVESNDTDTLASILTSSETIDKAYIESFAAYFQENTETFDLMLSSLETDITENSTGNSILIHAEESNKTLGIYPQYNFHLTPVTIKISSNFEETNVHIIDHDTLTLSDSEEVLLFTYLPNKYQIEFDHNTIYGDFSDSKSIDFWEAESLELEASVNFEGQSVSLKSNYPQATLVVNGEEVREIGEDTSYGPVTYDGTTTMMGMISLPWDTIYSEEITIEDTDQTEVVLDLPIENDGLKSDIYNRIATHVDEWIMAYTYQSTNNLTVMRNQAYLDNTADNFERMYQDDSNFVGDVEQITFDNGHFNISKENDTYQVNIITELQFRSGYYETGERSNLDFDVTKHYWNYQFIYDEEEQDWFIEDSEEVNDFKTNDLIEYY